MGSTVAWFTGLSGSWKTVIARIAAGMLEGRGHNILILDGDAVPATVDHHLGFSREEIREI